VRRLDHRFIDAVLVEVTKEGHVSAVMQATDLAFMSPHFFAACTVAANLQSRQR
jgi:hypothetical protein